MSTITDSILADYIWERSHVLLLLADANGRITRHNPESGRVFNRTLLGVTLETLFGAPPRPGTDSPVRLNILTEENKAETYYFHFETCGEDTLAIGETDPIEIHRLRNDLMGLHHEVMLLNHDLQKKSAALDSLNQLKNKFLGIAAHDLRNPLGILYGHARLLQQTLASKEAQTTESIEAILSSAVYSLKLLDDLLDISHIESGKWGLDPSENDLLSWMDQFLNRNSPQAAIKGIHFERRFPNILPPIHLDPMRFEQVMGNLVTNAIKYAPPGSVVTVAIQEASGGVEIVVSDTGPGIPADEMSQLFEDFSRTSVKTTAGEKSTGLGLAIARRIVEAHAGKIWAESIEGKGGIFKVWLPLGRRAPKET
jgi:signal transduction histidine kinase